MAAVPKRKEIKEKQAAFSSFSLKRRRLADNAARVVVTFGGIAIILSILAILVFISLEVYPLLKGAEAELSGRFNLNGSQKPLLTSAKGPGPISPVSVSNNSPVVALGVEQYREVGFVITKAGMVNFVSLDNGRSVKQIPIAKLEGRTITSASGSLDNGQYILGTDKGYVLPLKVNFKVSFIENLKGIEQEIVKEVIKPEEKRELNEGQQAGETSGNKETRETREGRGQINPGEKKLAEETQKTGTGGVVVEPEAVKEAMEAEKTAEEGQQTGSEVLESITQRIIEPEIVEGELIQISNLPILRVAYQAPDEDTKAIAAVTSDGKLLFHSQQVSSSLFGKGEMEEFKHDLTLDGGAVTALALDSFLENLYAGTEEGKIYHWDIRDKASPKLVDIIDATEGNGTAITALGFLIGDRSLIVGDESGAVSTWFQVTDKSSPMRKSLKQVHSLPSSGSPITAVAASPRDKGLVAADSKGEVSLYHSTSERKLLQMKAGDYPIKAVAFAPKRNGAVAVDENGTLYDWKIENPHPETTFRTLFGKVWYEGYDKPEYVWQSTGGTDDFEPKLSLTPLVFGTLKGTFYALLFAIPIAILGAICVSQFMHPSLRNTIKPVIEIMAALPSVVLGFLAGLWMAPLVEKIIPALTIMPIVLTLLTLLSVILWRVTPKWIRVRFKGGTEFFLLIPVFIVGVQISLWLNGPVESLIFGGDYKFWLFNGLGLQYDQRNSLVVGYAMAFAVIPIIFTISEDALSNVPKHLTSGSLALGATKWQTAIRVVLPTAAAGIFSAVMIGFGRAVGETMIVLMATGNTPIMDWNIFNGFRALSANIAVEIPEAPHGGTLYRVIFLAALLLFIMTFILNTAAEIVRQRLRKKYGQL